MTSSTSTSAQQPTSNDPSLELIAQFYAGPSFREAATATLRQALNEHYPNLNIDPGSTLMGSPTWTLVGDELVAGPPDYHALSDLLARQAVLAVPALCIEGEHFLTRQPVTDPPVHLPVRMTDIAKILNTRAPVMLSVFQDYLVDYWNESTLQGPRWQELSSTLRNGWNVQGVEGWNETDHAMARRLFRLPERTTRQTNDPYATKASIVEVQQTRDGSPKFAPLMFAVLSGQHQGRMIILSYSLLKGYEKFDSLEQLGQSLPEHLGPQADPSSLQWRLYEPDGHFFDYLACTFIAQQVDAVGAIDFSDLRQGSPSRINSALNSTPGADDAAAQKGPGLEWYRDALPDWLSAGSTGDLNNYARHLKDLAALDSQHAGESYLDGIPGIEEYALAQLKQQVLIDHPDAQHLPLDKVVVRVQSVVTWGTFIVPGATETTTFTLVELALQNLIALPLGTKTVQLPNGAPLPAWLTVDYVEQLIQEVDIGKNYPELIKAQLVDIRQEATRRRNLYTEQVRIQLPLMALQSKLRQQNGIDEQGYRYIAALMNAEAHERKVDNQTIVMRPLAFAPKRRTDGAYDTVENMYVIGPQSLTAGPCLLYRPLFDPPLVQYASHANLIYAIAQSETLRSSVLAWLPDAVREDYANYVFPRNLPSPWAVAEYLVEPDKLWTLSGPMTLANTVLNGDILGTLFNANAQALIALADRTSVSNAESRWATLKQAGWTLLNAVLPFLSPTLGTAAWIWQILDQLKQFVEAEQQHDTATQQATLTDVLLNLGLAIILHIATRHSRTGPAPAERHEAEPTIKKLIVKQVIAPPSSEQATDRVSPLNIVGAVNRLPGKLGSVLDTFKVDKPTGLGDPITETGTYQHLYRSGQHYYVPVGTRWFEVSAEPDEPVHIIDPKLPERSGPILLHNAAGQWFTDTRLRLRGGGPKRAIKRASLEAAERAKQLRDKLQAFEKAKKTAQVELQQAHTAMTDAPGTSTEAKRQLYLQKLASQRADYETALQQLKELNVFDPLPDYQTRAMAYLKAQLDLSEASISETQRSFTPVFRRVLDQIERQAQAPHERHVEDARVLTEMNRDMIERLDYVQSRFEELRQLPSEGLRQIQERKKRLPAYTSSDLRALQVTMTRNLCMTEASLSSAPDAWEALDQIVNTADIAIQALRDTLHERSETRLDERIEALGSLIEQFAVIEERIEDLPQDFSDAIIPEQLEKLRATIRRYAHDTQVQLTLLHLDRDALRRRPTPPPTPPKPKMKFIHTRYNGVLIGEPRLTSVGLETGLVDIKSPITQQVIATYHQKGQDVYVQRISTPTPTPPAVPDIQVALDKAKWFLDDLHSFKTRADEQAAKPTRTAMGIEYLYHQHALRLEETDQAIEHGLASASLTADQHRAAAILSRKLKEATAELYQEATQHMQRMIREQAPTVAGVEWLLQRHKVTLKKTMSRRRLKSAKPDYLDEYTIADRTSHEVLWYAHFHYSTSWTPAKAFISARLKTPAERRLGLAADTLNGLNAQQRLDYYRSEINLEQARRLFFNL
ncbi:dermonecrotic toxin domain-containing protein [Pseudomonas rhodesiae]|uniref:dermonecrotic toxin domain-containing protein n=1 Tax=Pseudomonas rhodesiae TaxID=76760 RepID=UPI0032B23D91